MFKKKQPEPIIDQRSEIEKSFEEKGQKIGANTGEIIETASQKVNAVKAKVKENEKLQGFNQKTLENIQKSKSRVIKKKTQKDDK